MIKYIFCLMLAIFLTSCSSSGGGGVPNTPEVISDGGGVPNTPEVISDGGGVPNTPEVISDGGDGDGIPAVMSDPYVLGAVRLYQERGRIPANMESPLHFIDENPAHHATHVRETAEIYAFGDVRVENVRVVNQHPGASDGTVFRSIIGSYDESESPGYVVNISYGPLFDHMFNRKPELIPVDLLQQKRAALVIATGNSPGRIDHGETGGLAAARAGFVLFVTGYDRGDFRRGRYRIALTTGGFSGASPCLWAKEYCVAASYTSETPSGGTMNGTSFAAPFVASLLANARLLWPSMTSEQTLNLARYCARPVQSDGTLGAWGEILTEAEADDDLGQGVFSVECLFEPNGGLVNPITDERLSGGAVLLGTHTAIILTDPFGRSYRQSDNRAASVLPFLPTRTPDIFFEQDGILGLGWGDLALGMRMEENRFFGSFGRGDFRFGDSFNLFVQLGHRFEQERYYFSFYALSAWARMNGARHSIVAKAEGHSHQLTTRFGYRGDYFETRFELIHSFGVRGKLTLKRLDRISLAPAARTTARLRLLRNF